MDFRFARAVAIGVLIASPATAAPSTPTLTKAQRAVLQAVVAAVDAAAAQPDTPTVQWQTHVLRTSDGSHYIAFSVADPNAAAPKAPLTLYVRLATRPASPPSAMVERSAVMDWLIGLRSDPLPARAGRVVTVPTGELPVGGPSMTGRFGNVAEASTALRLMDRKREQARQQKEDQEKQRRAELEKQLGAPRLLYPFEDFDVTAVASAGPAGGALVSRSVTAGPGEYDLYVGWAESAETKAPIAVHVAKRTLRLPPASMADLSLSSIIVADRVGVRAAPYGPEEQTAHPYTIGATEIIPARDAVFTRDERLTVAFQVINARPSETGKPDVAVTFRIVRMAGDREQPVAALTPQRYGEATLPADFDVRLGHPIFAAVAAPLATLARGTYRLKIGVSDIIAGAATAGETEFRIVGTPASLLAEAPSLGLPYRREMALAPATVDAVVTRLQPSRPSAALARLLDAATARRFVDLLREEPVDAHEQGVRAALTGIALYALGDASSTVQFQKAVQQNAAAAPVQMFVGAVRALDGRDADAIAAWQAALDGGMPVSVVLPLLMNAHLRRGDGGSAAALIASVTRDRAPDAEWWRVQAAAEIAAGREVDAVARLESRLAQRADDTDAQWLLLHALFAGIVRDQPTGVATERVERLTRAARDYIAAGGPHAALAAEWIGVLATPATP